MEEKRKTLSEIIKENSLIICPDSYKNRVLKYLSDNKIITNISFLTLEEYRKNYYFDYDVRTIKHLMDKYDLSPNNAKEIIENLYYITDKKYNVEKLDRLVEYKNDLEQKHLLIHNDIFRSYISKKMIIVVGYGKLNPVDRRMFDDNTVFVEYEHNDKSYIINQFKNIEQEVEYLYDQITDLLIKGIDINKIFVLNANSEYENYFKRFNTYYSFNVEYKNRETLFGTTLAKEFVESLDTADKEEIYNNLKNKGNEISDSIISIINKYPEYKLKEIKELIIDDLKNTSLKTEKLIDVVKCADMFDEFDDDDQVFLLGFNDDFPHTKQDTAYITNNVRHLVDMPTCEEENELIKENTINYLSNINNLYLSYSETNPFGKHETQNLIVDVEYRQINIENTYSDRVNKANYGDMLDRLNKYGSLTESISDMHETYGKNDYLSYDNSFNRLNKEQIDGINSVRLSYSSMDSYYKCAFRYYIEKILKISDFKGNYNTQAGSVAHGVLKDYYEDPGFDFEESWNRNVEIEEKKIKEKLFTEEKEKFFIDKIKEELKQDIEIIQEQKENSILDKQRCEENYNINVTDNIEFTGYIDKLMYHQNSDETIASIVDYKTGSSAKIKEKLFVYGLSLQLPSYLYLLSKDKDFKDAKIGGYYLQYLINQDNKYNEKKTAEEIKNESMKLDGYSSCDIERLQACDYSLLNSDSSSSIKSVKINNDGSLSKYSKVVSDAQMKELVELVENKVLEAGTNILNGEFEINPKQIDGENVSCRYCPFIDICYKRNDDLVVETTQDKEEQ